MMDYLKRFTNESGSRGKDNSEAERAASVTEVDKLCEEEKEDGSQ